MRGGRRARVGAIWVVLLFVVAWRITNIIHCIMMKWYNIHAWWDLASTIPLQTTKRRHKQTDWVTRLLWDFITTFKFKPAIANNNCRPTTQSSGIWDKNMNMQSPAQDFGERVITLNRAHVNNFGGRRARIGVIEIVRSNGWVFQWLGIWKMYLRRMTIPSPRVILVRDGQNCVLRILPWDRCGTRGPLIHRHCNTSLDSLWSWFKRNHLFHCTFRPGKGYKLMHWTIGVRVG